MIRKWFGDVPKVSIELHIRDIRSPPPLAVRSKKYYGGMTSWPDITVKFRMGRRSFIDQKIAVLPIIRKRQSLSEEIFIGFSINHTKFPCTLVPNLSL